MDELSVPASAAPPRAELTAREWLGLVIVAAGVLILASEFWRYVTARPVVWNAFLGGSVAAVATALGTVPVMFSQRLSERVQDTLFGFGAGVMLAACAFSLIIPGLEAAKAQNLAGGSPWAAGSVIGLSILLGGAVLMLMDKLLPHEHFIKGREGMDGEAVRKLRRTWLFVFAIALHNLPEGLAIGVGYAGNDGLRGNALATGIAIQDVPEGLVVAVALLAAGYKRWIAVGLGMASGLVEPLGAVLGASIIGWSAALLPWGLGFAAGANLFGFHLIFPLLKQIVVASVRRRFIAWFFTAECLHQF